MDNQMSGDNFDKMKLKQFGDNAANNDPRHLIPPQNDDAVGSQSPMKQEKVLPHQGEIGTTTCLSILNQVSTGCLHITRSDKLNYLTRCSFKKP